MRKSASSVLHFLIFTMCGTRDLTRMKVGSMSSKEKLRHDKTEGRCKTNLKDKPS